MIGLDLDGTLLNSKKEVTDHTKSVLEEAIAQGIIVLVATGDRKSTRLNSSHASKSRMPSSA